MDTEEPSYFNSLCEKFQGASRSSTLPAYTTKRQTPAPKIGSIRINPAFQGVISTLENQVKAPAPPIAKKPQLPPKPNDLSRSINDMKRSKVFKQTFHITNSSRTDGDGMCANSPQVYRHTMAIFPDPPPPETGQPQTQDVYEEVDSPWTPSTPIKNLKNEKSKRPPAPGGPKPVKKISSLILDAAKNKKNEKVDKGPTLKPLPSIACLGSPPAKIPRPPNVDLSAFFTKSLQKNGVSNEPEESAEGEYEQPAPSPTSNEDELYDEAFSSKESTERDCNVYEVDDIDREPTEGEYEQPAPSPTSNEDELYDEAFSLKESTERDCNVYEVDDMDRETPTTVNPAPGASSLKETDEMLCYEDILKLAESVYSDNVYNTEDINPVNMPEIEGECTYEVSADNNHLSDSSTMSSYPSVRSSVSEGYSSAADLDTSGESFRWKAKIGKNEQTFRNKFKISGLEKILYTSIIMEDFKPEKYSLPVKKGDNVEVIRITDCPAGKWLVRHTQGNYGFVPVASLQVSDGIKAFSNQHQSFIPVIQDLYSDVEVRPNHSGDYSDLLTGSDDYSVKSEEQYDDISNTSQTPNSSGGKGKVFGHLFRKDKSKKEDAGSAPVIPNINRTTSQENEENHTYAISDDHDRDKEEKFPGWKSLFYKNKEQKGTERKKFSPGSGVKKLAKEEKIFREKFKYTGEITVLNIATINNLVPPSPKHKLELSVNPGETVEVIDVTNEDQIICRNFAGKYGYVQIECLNFRIQNFN
ncbi:FYN-binding protein 2 [Rhinoderma darwinii]|uniref:FYN-binding protein 2 n=1 Tax=Rhinoderma darwinii TaxID=43563 RepID=UPI003F66E94F